MLQRYNANRRYLEFRGRPILSVGSAEHYGAALNADFEYKAYIDECVRYGLNQGRVFSGSYRESPGWFGIEDNTLAPKPEAFLCPWKKVGDKWDLTQWDETYWTRLKEIAAYASEREYLLEYVLFCYWYGEDLWEISPMHPANCVQGIKLADRWRFYDPNGPLVELQKSLTRKAAQELKAFNNIYFEICNEPYSRHDHNAFLDWHTVLAETLRAETDALIAVNYNNRMERLERLVPQTDIINFHYAHPLAAAYNYHFDMVLADDETGFAGQSPEPYRREAWRFFLSGGAMFSHLDYSFTTAHPDGTHAVTGKTPGYGGADLRAQFGFLRTTLEAAKVWELAPMNEIFAWNSGAVSAAALGAPGKRYIVYDDGDAGLATHGLGLPAGEYAIRWLDPAACKEIHAETRAFDGSGLLRLSAPNVTGETVVILEKVS